MPPTGLRHESDAQRELQAWQVGDDYDVYLSELVASSAGDERFIVFYDGDLVRSTRERLPPVHGRAYARYVAEQRWRRPDVQGYWRA